MAARRQWVLAGVLALIGLFAAVVLFDVLGTVFFAITVAYVLVPLDGRLVDLGLSRWISSAIATVVAFLSVVVLFASFGFLLYRRRTEVLVALTTLPESLTLEAFGFVYVVDASVVSEIASEYLTAIAFSVARLTPILAIKGTVFALLVFALLVRRRQTRRALLGPIPHAYRDVAAAFHERARQTLSAIYVLQAATALATFLIALPFFYLLNFDLFITLALIAGFLQFLPIIGPSLLVAVLAVFRLTAGDVTGAVLLFVLGAVLVGWLPDALVRPRLARETAHLPGSLYFVGFTGGLLSVGPIGVIAGPLVVALLAEAAQLLAAEVDERGRTDGEDDSV